jgi:putative ATP-binding cassette transporter
VGFFTTGYNWLIQIIPALIIAPAFIRGSIPFGVITQSAMAFSTLVAAFSLIVTQYQSLSTIAVAAARLNSLVQALEQPPKAMGSAIEIVEAEGPLAYERLTLLQSTNDSPLLKDLSISIPFGTRVLIAGSNRAAGEALFRVTAGVSTAGAGRIIRPGGDDILFLAQQPYVPQGTLREVLVPIDHAGEISDEQIFALLRELNLEQVAVQAGGLDKEQDWGTLLSLQEQQLLTLIHILLAAPRFAFLDRANTVLDTDQVHQILQMFSKNSVTYINNGEADHSRDLYDAVLQCGEDGAWRWTENPAGPMPAADSQGSGSDAKARS